MDIRIGLVLGLFCLGATGGDHIDPQSEDVRAPAVAQKPASPGDPNRVLVVLFSGFKSCDDRDFLENLKTDFVPAFRRKHPEKTVDFVRYCYDRSKGSVRVQLPGQDSLSPVQSTLREALFSLEQLKREYGNTQLIGHSWGAWSLMRAVEGMGKPPLVNPSEKGTDWSTPFSDSLHDGWADAVADLRSGKAAKTDPRSEAEIEAHEALMGNDREGGYWAGYAEGIDAFRARQALKVVPPFRPSVLVTIDPISGKMSTGCNPGTVIRGAPPCKEFPKDIDQERVSSGVGHWLNYYQETQERLHSGPASRASNTLGSQKLKGTHSSIKGDPRLKEEVIAAMLEAID